MAPNLPSTPSRPRPKYVNPPCKPGTCPIHKTYFADIIGHAARNHPLHIFTLAQQQAWDVFQCLVCAALMTTERSLNVNHPPRCPGHPTTPLTYVRDPIVNSAQAGPSRTVSAAPSHPPLPPPTAGVVHEGPRTRSRSRSLDSAQDPGPSRTAAQPPALSPPPPTPSPARASPATYAVFGPAPRSASSSKSQRPKPLPLVRPEFRPDPLLNLSTPHGSPSWRPVDTNPTPRSLPASPTPSRAGGQPEHLSASVRRTQSLNFIRTAKDSPLPGPATPAPNILDDTDLSDNDPPAAPPRLALPPYRQRKSRGPRRARPAPSRAPPPPEVFPSRCGADLQPDDLLSFPTCRRIPSGRVRAAFRACVDRLSRTFVREPSEENLRPLLLAPKLALQAHLALGSRTVLQALARYPAIPTPPRPLPPQERIPHPTLRTSRLIAQGRIGAAARCLAQEAKLAPSGPATDEALANLHPDGPEFPFDLPDLARSRPFISTLSDEALEVAIQSCDYGTAAGPDGWNMPLILAVADLPKFREALRSVYALAMTDKAPCKDILLASTLIPLLQNDKVRPIAIGSLVYRILAKAAIHSRPLGPTLLPYQLGVGTPGGVEPIIVWVRHELDIYANSSDPPQRFLTTLDFKNAFNTVDRSMVARGVYDHAPHLFQLARWAYGSPSPLLPNRHASAIPSPPLLSKQGVRQGDPLGPVFFSLAIKSLLEDLNAHLGPSHNILSYLDDCEIIGDDPDVLDKVEDFLARSGSPLILNRAKSTVTPFADLLSSGVEFLGTIVGPMDRRIEFLQRKIQAQSPKLTSLSSLCRQDALILLRKSLQLNLAHLLRTLDPHGLSDTWKTYDDEIREALCRIRGPSPPGLALDVDPVLDASVMSLPVKLGGLGLLDHVERMGPAASAAYATGLKLLSPFFPTMSVPDDCRTQRVRHAAILAARHSAIASALHPTQRAGMLESASLLGRRWLAVLPKDSNLTLPDVTVAHALYSRALALPASGVCPLCNKANPGYAHSDACSALHARRTSRHTNIARGIGRALETIPACMVSYEPPIPGKPASFNDVRLSAGPAAEVPSVDIDVTIASFSGARARETIRAAIAGSAPTPAPPAPVPLPPASPPAGDDTAPEPLPLPPAGNPMASPMEGAQKVLQAAAMTKITNQGDYTPDAPPFHPFVLSSGGVLLDASLQQLGRWKAALAPHVYSRLLDVLSCALLSNRALGLPPGPAHSSG